MKPLVKRLLESGIIERHTAKLFERWGQLDTGAADLVGQKSLKDVSSSDLEAFAEEIDELVEQERESMKETRLDVQVSPPEHWDSHKGRFSAVRDRMNNLILSVEDGSNLNIGFECWRTPEPNKRYIVMNKVYLYQGDVPMAVQVTIGKTW